MEPTKTCTKCFAEKPLSAFYASKRAKDGRRQICIPCWLAIAKARYSADPEYKNRLNAQGALRRLRLRGRHPERYFMPFPHKPTKSYLRAAAKKYRSTPRWQEYSTAFKARRRGATVLTLTAAEWSEIKAAHGQACAYCKRTDRKLEMDHVLAIMRGGEHTAANIVPSCPTCNRRKSNLPVEEFLKKLAQ